MECEYHLCHNKLTGRQTKFCSKNCNVKFRVSKWRREVKATLVKEHGGRCRDCWAAGPPFMFDFDHKDPSVKEFQISRANIVSIDKVREEAKKCDLVCSNCHRTRTHLQRCSGCELCEGYEEVWEREWKLKDNFDVGTLVRARLQDGIQKVWYKIDYDLADAKVIQGDIEPDKYWGTTWVAETEDDTDPYVLWSHKVFNRFFNGFAVEVEVQEPGEPWKELSGKKVRVFQRRTGRGRPVSMEEINEAMGFSTKTMPDPQKGYKQVTRF